MDNETANSYSSEREGLNRNRQPESVLQSMREIEDESAHLVQTNDKPAGKKN